MASYTIFDSKITNKPIDRTFTRRLYKKYNNTDIELNLQMIESLYKKMISCFERDKRNGTTKKKYIEDYVLEILDKYFEEGEK